MANNVQLSSNFDEMANNADTLMDNVPGQSHSPSEGTLNPYNSTFRSRGRGAYRECNNQHKSHQAYKGQLPLIESCTLDFKKFCNETYGGH